MLDVPVGELVLVRFSPFGAHRLAEAAQDEYDEALQTGKEALYSISTYGLVRPDEATSVEELIKQVCQRSGLNGRSICAVTRAALEDSGFSVKLSEPPPLHYDVVLGSELVERDTERLAEVLETGRRRNPAWNK